MKRKAKGKKRGPYKCTACREYGHRANKCLKKQTAETILNALPGDVALASLIPEHFQILAVIEDQVPSALRGAVETNRRLAEAGKDSNNSLINAWAELAKREARIPQSIIARAQAARAALMQAELVYEDALEPIRAAIKAEKASKR